MNKKQLMANQLMKLVDIEQNAMAKALAGGLAEMERAQAEALRELADAHGYDLDVQVPDPDQREQLLLEGAKAATDGRGVEWWIETRYGHRLENAAEAAEYLDLEPETWTDEEREEAAEFIRERFGVELDWFVSEIVGLDRSQVVRELLAGNLESIELAIRDAAQQEPDTAAD